MKIWNKWMHIKNGNMEQIMDNITRLNDNISKILNLAITGLEIKTKMWIIAKLAISLTQITTFLNI